MSFKNLVNLKNLKKNNLPYVLVWIIYYAWVIVFTTWWTASPETDAVYGADIRAFLHITNLVASAVFVFVLKREQFKISAQISSACLLASAAVFLLIPDRTAHLIAAAVLALSIGCLNAAILVPFVFVLNNTEKFYSVLLSNLLISALVLLQESNALNVTGGSAFSLVMLFLAVFPVVFFKKKDLTDAYPKNVSNVPKFGKITYLTIALNCVYAILCKSVGKMFLLAADSQTTAQLEPYFYCGALLGCGLYFLIYCVFKNSNQTTWNVTFSTFVAAMLLYAFGKTEAVVLVVFSILLGIGSTMGMINMYYILGVIGKKYFSIKYVRLSILFIGICGGVSGILLGKWAEASPVAAGMVLAVFSAIVMVLLLMLSPVLSQKYFSDSWATDSEKSDVTLGDDFLLRYNLSKREDEICRLLLQGYTMRQTAAFLDISYATVNTYCTALYRKLNINSRTELLLMFKEYLPKRLKQ